MDDKLLEALTELVRETTRQKQQERLKTEEAKEGPKANIWKWFKENTASLTALVSVLAIVGGGIWTVYQFTDQQQQRLEQQQRADLLQRQSMIVQFAEGLSDTEKRNTSAYALAILSGEEAVPLLLPLLREAAQSEQDTAFRDALIQALITIGEPALDPVLDMNRQAAFQGDIEQNPVISATQPIIVHFLTDDVEVLRKDLNNFAGIGLQNVQLAYRDFDRLDLSGLRIRNGSLRYADLTNANLEGVFFSQVDLGCVDFRGSILSGGNFRDSNIERSNLRQVTAEESLFEGANLDNTILTEATLTNTIFTSGHLFFTNFDNAQLTNAWFPSVNALRVSFVGAELENVDFAYANLDHADFSNANLMNAKFFNPYGTSPASPRIPPSASTIMGDVTPPNGSGAYVKDANFEGARNVNEDTRKYLCKWGATNVPGGCEDISQEDIPYTTNYFIHSSPGRPGYTPRCF